MSTFDGFVEEFPRIRIDCFRKLPGKVPPFACFLSHVHSDHLTGLESLRSPFVYCSSATRELLLRLEKYPHRVNLSKGILERRIQTYKSLQKILKALPLDTPTKLELSPGNEIQVTLLNANHCLGAVMFLIEGHGTAILYTGDVRSEPWWVNSLTRNPVLLPYASGIKRLSRIYLDTTFAEKAEPYREFQSKADGIRELLEKIALYPNDTTFYFRAWTFGYEDVWIALSHFLNSRIHLDDYRYRIYTSVGACKDFGLAARESASLAGFSCGNDRQNSILTRDPTVRIHSCEGGSSCPLWYNSEKVVEITPIVSRRDGLEMRELGAGGGKGDLDQIPELDIRDQVTVKHLLDLCNTQQKNSSLSTATVETIRTTIASEASRLELPSEILSTEDIKLAHLPTIITNVSERKDAGDCMKTKLRLNSKQGVLPSSSLAKSITFPYARHSSYTELRGLVSAFRPVDVFPCTVPLPDEWIEELSMQTLFGDLCENQGRGFVSDNIMRARRDRAVLAGGSKRKRETDQETESDEDEEEEVDAAFSTVDAELTGPALYEEAALRSNAADIDSCNADTSTDIDKDDAPAAQVLSSSQRERLRARRDAFRAANKGVWQEINLVSVRDDRTDEEL